MNNLQASVSSGLSVDTWKVGPSSLDIDNQLNTVKTIMVVRQGA